MSLTVVRIIRDTKQSENEGDGQLLIDRAHYFGHIGEVEVLEAVAQWMVLGYNAR